MLLFLNISFKSNLNEIISYIIIYELILCYETTYCANILNNINKSN